MIPRRGPCYEGRLCVSLSFPTSSLSNSVIDNHDTYLPPRQQCSRNKPRQANHKPNIRIELVPLYDRHMRSYDGINTTG
ncbi:hypothetical protein AFLA_009313 [Aspergillus flavus NRRL3357]|nr:hypothetical protein AFLA_009313 [Aspergillus flavus NRRL3357]